MTWTTRSTSPMRARRSDEAPVALLSHGLAGHSQQPAELIVREPELAADHLRRIALVAQGRQRQTLELDQVGCARLGGHARRWGGRSVGLAIPRAFAATCAALPGPRPKEATQPVMGAEMPDSTSKSSCGGSAMRPAGSTAAAKRRARDLSWTTKKRAAAAEPVSAFWRTSPRSSTPRSQPSRLPRRTPRACRFRTGSVVRLTGVIDREANRATGR